MRKRKGTSPGWQKTRAHENHVVQTVLALRFLFKGRLCLKYPFLNQQTHSDRNMEKGNANPACAQLGREDGLFVREAGSTSARAACRPGELAPEPSIFS